MNPSVHATHHIEKPLSRSATLQDRDRGAPCASRFPARLDVDDFCTVNRRTLLRGLGSAALLTATGGLFRGGVWASPVFAAHPSHSASPRVIQRRTAS